MATATLPERIIRRLVEGPLGKKILAEEASERFETRKAATAEIKKLEEVRLKERPGLTKALEDAEEGVKQARLALEAAQGRYRLARNDLWNLDHRTDTAQERQRQVSREVQPACIRAFLDELLEIQGQMGRATYGGLTASNSIYDGALRKQAAEFYEKWHASIERRLQAIKDAREAAPRLAFEPLTDQEIETKIEELRAAVLGAGIFSGADAN